MDIPPTSPTEANRSTIAVLLELAGLTYGFFLSRDARDRGVLPSALSRLRSQGIIEAVAHGVNRIVCWPDSWEGRALAALWSAGATSALARWAALRVLESRSGTPLIEVVVPRSCRVRRATTDIRTHVRLTPGDVIEWGRFRITSPAFTVCDLAAVLSTERIVAVADRLIASGVLDLEELRHMVGRFWAIEGVERLREALAQLSPASRWTRSDGERAWRRLIAGLGLPQLVANHRVVDADGRRRYLDFCWPHLRVAFEIDLHPSHGRTIGRNADGARQNALVLAGWQVFRFDLTDLMVRPDHVVATVLRAYESATSARSHATTRSL